MGGAICHSPYDMRTPCLIKRRDYFIFNHILTTTTTTTNPVLVFCTIYSVFDAQLFLLAPSRMFTTNSLCLIVCPFHEWRLLFRIFKSNLSSLTFWKTSSFVILSVHFCLSACLIQGVTRHAVLCRGGLSGREIILSISTIQTTSEAHSASMSVRHLGLSVCSSVCVDLTCFFPKLMFSVRVVAS